MHVCCGKGKFIGQFVVFSALVVVGVQGWFKDGDHRHKLLSFLCKVAGLVLRNRMRSSDILDAFRVGLLLLHVEEPAEAEVWASGCIQDV